MTRRMLLASLALVLVTAGCGGSSKSSFPTIAPAHTYALTGFQPSAPVAAGKPTQVSFTITQPNGKPLTDFKTGPGPHTGVHLIIVRRDLDSIVHVHPPIAPDGKISTTLTFTKPGPYRVVVDAYPNTTGPQPNFQLFELACVSPDATSRRGCRPSPRPSWSTTATASRCTAGPTLHAIQAGSLTITVTDPNGKPARVHAVVRRARARDLLPEGNARLLPYACLRARRVGLYELPRRDEGDRQLVDARKADRRGARPGRRRVASLPSVPGGRSHPDRAVHPGRQAMNKEPSP